MGSIDRREMLKASGTVALGSALFGLPGPVARAADAYADAVLVDGPPPASADGSFTLAVLPDTQNYAQRFPETFVAQTEWLVQEKAARNIVGVLHLGDITNRNSPEQWEHAVRAMHILDGHLPYCLVPGNHDYSEGGTCSDRSTLLNDYFPVADFQGLPSFGGTYDRESDRMENSYHLLSAEGVNLLVLALEFGPRRDVVRWANEVVGAHPDRSVILITHAYLYSDDTRYDWSQYGDSQTWNPHSYRVASATADDVLDGQQLWDELVSKHDHFALTLNGHVLHDGLGRLTSTTPSGRVVHQMLVNYQMRPAGGDGWLRLLEFRPACGTIQVYDYSPTRHQQNVAPTNRFLLTFPSTAPA